MDSKLTTVQYWEDNWSDIKLPLIRKPSYDLFCTFNKYLPSGRKDICLIEIGCAPGGWLAFFYKNFGYHVRGIEYAQRASEITNKNLMMQNVEATIMVEDFLNIKSMDLKNDIVFSAGFIEHFTDTENVVRKIYRITEKYVITVVPNTFGINGWISKTFRPIVYKNHVPIDLKKLRFLHENVGFETILCQYIVGPKIIPPIDKCDFSKKHKKIAVILNSPIFMLNKFFELINNYLHFGIRNSMFCS